jgi:chromosome segregation ATPase
MMRKKMLVTLVLVALAACHTEKRRLAERLANVERQYREISHRLTTRRSAMSASEDRLRALRLELALQDTESQRYLQQHRIAAGCIRASRATWGSAGERAGEVPKGVKVGEALCNLALLSRTFTLEVNGVAERLAQADRRGKALREQIGAEERSLDQQRSEIRADEEAVDRVSASLNTLQQQLGR